MADYLQTTCERPQGCLLTLRKMANLLDPEVGNVKC